MISQITYYMKTWVFEDIETRRREWWELFEQFFNTGSLLPLSLRDDSWKWFIYKLSEELLEANFYNSAMISSFFGCDVLDFDRKLLWDDYYYKWISPHILFSRQIICEWYKYFDEFLDHFSPDFNTALTYAHWFKKYRRNDHEWIMMCINKEKLEKHLTKLKQEYKGRRTMLFEIQKNSSVDFNLYHSIVPISCVDYFIKFPPKK